MPRKLNHIILLTCMALLSQSAASPVYSQSREELRQRRTSQPAEQERGRKTTREGREQARPQQQEIQEEFRQRRASREAFKQLHFGGMHFNLQEFEKSLQELEIDLEQLDNLPGLQNLEGLAESLQGLQGLERLEGLEGSLDALDGLEGLHNLESFHGFGAFEAFDAFEAFRGFDAFQVFSMSGHVAEAGLSEEEQIKLQSLRAVAGSDKERSVAILERELSETESAVLRKHIVRYVAEVRTNEAIRLLGKIAKTDADAGVRKRAVYYLGRADSEHAAEILRDILTNQ